jgi:hypothetical protein
LSLFCNCYSQILVHICFCGEYFSSKSYNTRNIQVVCESSGICLTANHCLKDLPRRPKLYIGGYCAHILAQDEKKDIAALKIDSNTNFQCIKLGGNCEIRRTMKVQLLSYPVMADTEYGPVGPTVTHGQVVNIWTPNIVGADYISFPNSSGGAVVHGSHLIGIHQGIIWNEDPLEEGETGVTGKVSQLARNMSNKGCLGNFVNAAAICNFLDDRDILSMPTFKSSSTASSSGRTRKSHMVATPQ